MKTEEDGRQIGGVFVSPDWIQDPRRANASIKQIADMGYSSMIILVRHQKRTVLDRAVHDAVKAMADCGHSRNLKVLLDTDHFHWGCSLVETHPEAALWAIRSVETTVRDGRFEMRVPFPAMPGQIVFQEISAVFLPSRTGYRYLPGTGVKATNQHFGSPSPGLMLKGQLPRRYSGKAVLYVAVRTYGLADVAHPRYLRGQQELLDAYADVPLDGFTWDEPGKGLGDMGCFKAGAAFMALFRRLRGYELRPHLIYLDRFDGTPQAVKIRCDYYGALIEMNTVAQKRHNDYARKVLKKDLMFGTHQTWSGFPTDLVAGCIDYFRQGKVLTAAWTDGGWDIAEPKYPVHNFMLAEGIKKELELRDAYYNDWGLSQPGVGNMRFANRLKMLFHVNWFNHCVSDFSEDLINFTQEPIRSAAEQDTRNLDRFDRLVGDAFAPHTHVACLYSWETLAAAPKWLTRMFYTFIANASLHLTDAGQYAALMSGDSILEAKIGRGCFTAHGFTYRLLLLPYINTLPEAVYRKAMRIADAGVPVIVIGPPPEFTPGGKRIGDDFARSLGFAPFTLAEYSRVLAEQTALPDIREWEPCWIDATYPVETTTAQPAYDPEGHLAHVRASDRPLYYMPTPDPREELTGLIASLMAPLVETYAEGTYYRFFPHRRDPDRLVVLAVAKGHVASFGLAPDKYGSALRPPVKPHRLKAIFRLRGGDLEMKGGTWCAVRVEDDQAAEAIGDCPDITWCGKRVRCSAVDSALSEASAVLGRGSRRKGVSASDHGSHADRRPGVQAESVSRCTGG